MVESQLEFDGFEHKPVKLVDPGALDEAKDDFSDYPPPHIEIDFEASPSVSELHAAFALDQPVTLISKSGETFLFRILSDLDYSGWLDNGVQLDSAGNVNTSTAPDYAFFEGQLHESGFPSPDPDPWIILIDPNTGPNKEMEKIFFWNGDPLSLA